MGRHGTDDCGTEAGKHCAEGEEDPLLPFALTADLWGGNGSVMIVTNLFVAFQGRCVRFPLDFSKKSDYNMGSLC